MCPAHFAAEDLLTEVVMERMLAGVATRRHARTAEPVSEKVSGTQKSVSKSAISRRFVRQTETALAELMARKPHLASRRPSGEIGQGASPSPATVDLAALLRQRAR